MVTVSAERAGDLVEGILVGHGTPVASARIVSQHLIDAELSGMGTHGVMMVPIYVEAITSGQLVPDATPEMASETEQLAVVRGHLGFGHIAAERAADTAVAKADQTGISAVALVESHHIGRIGHYVERAADARTVLMVWGGGQGEELPSAVPFGGARAVLHTNPIAVGFPLESGPPFRLDMATSMTSGAKVVQTRNRGERMPDGVIVDKHGGPTNDPADFFDGGAHIPFGGHKGYGLMVVAELLGRVITGADRYASPDQGSPLFRHSGNLFIAIKAGAFADESTVLPTASELLDRIRAVPPAPGFSEVLVPGDPESRARTRQEKEGIEVDDQVWEMLHSLAETAAPRPADVAVTQSGS